MRDVNKVNYDQGLHPTSHSDGRILGYDQKNWRGMKLVVENGAPRACMPETLAHGLTHIWQYENWPDAWENSLGTDESQQIYEGMATWSGIQFLYYGVLTLPWPAYAMMTSLIIPLQDRCPAYFQPAIPHDSSHCSAHANVPHSRRSQTVTFLA